MMDTEERIQAVSQFLLQSPPGEINDVLNGQFGLLSLLCPSLTLSPSDSTDVRNIISGDDSLQAGVYPALQEYNIKQFIVADVPGVKHQVREHSVYCRDAP